MIPEMNLRDEVQAGGAPDGVLDGRCVDIASRQIQIQMRVQDNLVHLDHIVRAANLVSAETKGKCVD